LAICLVTALLIYANRRDLKKGEAARSIKALLVVSCLSSFAALIGYNFYEPHLERYFLEGKLSMEKDTSEDSDGNDVQVTEYSFTAENKSAAKQYSGATWLWRLARPESFT
jgi:hypothetical protein